MISDPTAAPEIPPMPAAVIVAPQETAAMKPSPKISAPGSVSPPEVTPKLDSAKDTLPYVYASPWAGRHFDSVTVALHCQENCAMLYSLQDSIHLLKYEGPVTFRQNATLWFSGVSKRGHRTAPIRLDYVIEKKPNPCGTGMMPVSLRGRETCMDVYEWPDREDAKPLAMINQAQASDSCKSKGKRLCSEDEWRAACEGPKQSRYPYGESYDERYCPAQQGDPSRSGRFPACRSYYGIYDLTGNLWEWTSTVDPDHDDFYLVAGGNWEAAEKGTCSLAKYSFYPQNTYPAVGFRCCEEVK